MPAVRSRRSNFFPWVSVRTRSGFLNGWSRTVAAFSVATSEETDATGLSLSAEPPQAVSVSAEAASRAAASRVFLRMVMSQGSGAVCTG